MNNSESTHPSRSFLQSNVWTCFLFEGVTEGFLWFSGPRVYSYVPATYMY
jgi:hypothetical protein